MPSVALPAALERWREPLADFVPELALALAPLVRRLSLAIGPSHATAITGDEPDGYGGIVRRGSYERLLASEWLLAGELPDEFDRRATHGEHLFLELARRRPAGGARCVALFDGGPAQLGSPRIAQLATLIVLAERAERAGVRFEWGLVQGDTTIAGITRHSVRRLLERRAATEAGAADLERWAATLGGDELWTVGATRLGRRAIVVGDVFEPGARQLAVTVWRDRRRGTELVLELPPDDACARLIRDPYGEAVAPPLPESKRLRARFASNAWFSPSGRKLVARLANGTLAILSVPTSPRGGRAIAVHSPKHGERIVAAGHDDRTAWVVTLDADERLCHVKRLGKHGGPHPHMPDRIGLRVPTLGPRLGRVVTADRTSFTDSEGELFMVHLGEVSPLGVTEALFVVNGKATTAPRPTFFAAAPAGGPQYTVERHGRAWRFCALGVPQSAAELEPPAGAQVVGALAVPAALLLVDIDCRTLLRLERTGLHTVLRTEDDMAHVAVSEAGNAVAIITADGALTVATPTGTLIFREAPR